MTESRPPYRGRFAPSPTGPLHLGSLTTALASWLEARRRGGVWLLRMDDLDPPREVPGAADTILRQLEQLGLIPDEPVCFQSQRGEAYRAALETLISNGHAFYCRMTRKQLRARGGHHPGPQLAVPAGPDLVVRMTVPDEQLGFTDLFQGPQYTNLEEEGGAFVLRRRDGLFGYQLACALDEHHMGISHVIRGADLLASSFRQRLVLTRLGMDCPEYGHLPVLRDAQGNKLSKSTGAASVDCDRPSLMLHRALLMLGQQPPPELARAGVDTVLDWALEHWEPACFRGRLDINAEHLLATAPPAP